MAKRNIKVSDIPTQLANLEAHDFTPKDLEAIQKFKDKGMLGLATLLDTDIHRMMQLYLDGKSYKEIADLLHRDKPTILFLAQKLDWPTMRKDYLNELVTTLKDKVTESKIQSQKFLLNLSQAYQKKLGRNINDFMRTDDVSHFNCIDPKDISSYLKIVEMLHRLNNENLGHSNDKPLVGISGMGEGMTITKTGANTVEITPGPPTVMKSKLKEWADLQRQQEKKADNVPHDINTQEQTTNEKGNENE